jgi:RNA polymerase sigma-70 factor (family 1)
MHKQERNEERKMLESLAQGSTEAFTHFFDLYRRRVFTVALKFLKSRELAEEVVQDVFLKVWRRREELARILNFEAYLFTMARHQIFDSLRDLAEETKAKQEFVHDIRSASTTDQLVVERQYEEILQSVVNLLPPQQKQIFHLAKREGLSHQAIAEQLKISRLTVKAHMAKALQTIRQTFQHHIITFALTPLIPPVLRELF